MLCALSLKDAIQFYQEGKLLGINLVLLSRLDTIMVII